MTTEVRAVTCGSSCWAVWEVWLWRLEEEEDLSVAGGGWRTAWLDVVGVSDGDGREELVVLVGANDGTGLSNRSLDVDLTGGVGFGLRWFVRSPFEGGGADAALDDSSFRDSPFMYCDMSLAILCCRKSSLT